MEKEEDKEIVKTKVRKSVDLLRGQKIIARHEVDGFYYPGIDFRDLFFV